MHERKKESLGKLKIKDIIFFEHYYNDDKYNLL